MSALPTFIRRQFSILRTVAYTTYKDWSTYRSTMMVSILVGPLFFLVQIAIWTSVFSTQGSISGMSLNDMIRYFGIATLMGYFTFDASDYELQEHVQKGTFITFMLRPISYSWYAFGQKIGHRILALLIELTPVLLLFTVVFRVDMKPKYPIYALISISLSFILIYFTNFCIGLLAFWFTKTEGLRRAFLVLKEFSSGMLLPLILFPIEVQKILFFLPFQFLTYVPGRVYIGSYELGGISISIPQVLLMQAAMTLLMFCLHKLLWRLAIKRFTGVGV